LPAISLSSAVNGYFTAVRRVSKSVAAGIMEQGIRIFSVMAFMSFLVPSDIESACALVVAGSVLADLVSTLLNMCLYFADLFAHNCKKDREKCENSSGELLKIALPMAVSSYIRSGLSTLEHIFIPRGLRAHGLSKKDTLAAYGRVHGMALQTILYPYALLTPFCSLLVPEIASRRAAGDIDGVRYVASRAIGFVMTFGIGCGVIMAAFAHDLGITVYNSPGAGRYILLLAPLVPVMYLDTVADSILKGMGEQLFCMKVNIFDSLVSVFIVLWLVPIMGIRGYVIEIVFCEAVNTAVSVSKLCKIIKIRADPVKNVLVPTVSAALAVFVTKTCRGMFPKSASESGGILFLTVAASGMIYMLLNCLLGGNMENDLKSVAHMIKKYLIFGKKGDTIRP
jgi:stage V sporulation protein B